MKTIEVTDEMYNSLMEISKEMNTQDNRCTAKPHLFQVQETKTLPTCDGCGDEIWVSDDGYEIKSKEALIDIVAEDLYDNDEKYAYIEGNDAREKATLEAQEMWNENECSNWLKENDYRRVEVQNVSFLSNCFFTSKACDEHIRINGHNLHEPVNYLTHAFRNPEMELVSKFLCELSGGLIK